MGLMAGDGAIKRPVRTGLINLMPGDSARPVMWHKGKDSASDVIAIPARDYMPSVERLKSRKTILCLNNKELLLFPSQRKSTPTAVTLHRRMLTHR